MTYAVLNIANELDNFDSVLFICTEIYHIVTAMDLLTYTVHLKLER